MSEVTVWHHEALPSDASDPEEGIFLSAPNNHDSLIFLHTFWSPALDFYIKIAINESLSFTMTSAILKVDVVCDVTMMPTPNVLMTELRDLLYNQCIDNILDNTCHSFFIYPTGLIIRIFNGCEVWIENSFMRVTVRHHKAWRVLPNSYPEWQNFQFTSNNH